MEKSIGPINSIVLARAGESDKIYKKDQTSIDKNGLCELMIKENQFMNFNDRSDYLQGLADKLFGVEYYLNDFVSTGIMYYDLLDMYGVKIYGKTYNCLMLNDEQNITQGLEENIHTDRPETSETDYKKADKTDQKINKTNLIVDKQNQSIQGIITQIGDRSEKETSITADIDGLASKVSDIEDVTETVEGNNSITLENCVAGPLLELHIYGNNTVFDQLYISDNLIISDDLIIYGDSRIQVTNTQIGSEESTTKVYELGVTDVLRQKGDIYDEYVLDNKQAKVIRRINKDGTVKTVPEEEIIGDYNIELLEGTNTITIQNYNAKLKAKFAFKNAYTDVFATKVEMNSEIKQTADSINLEVRKKVDENEVISKINQSAEQISIEAEKININGVVSANGNFKIDKSGNMSCNNANIDGGKIKIYGGDSNSSNFVVGTRDNTGNTRISGSYMWINGESRNDAILSLRENNYNLNTSISLVSSSNGASIDVGNGSIGNFISLDGVNKNLTVWGPVYANSYNNNSKEELKKNITVFNENAVDLIKNSDLYKFNYKMEKDTDKQHIGFIIGDGYKTPLQIISNDGNAIDSYSMSSILWKAIQEQQEIIEKLQKRLEKLEKGEK